MFRSFGLSGEFFFLSLSLSGLVGKLISIHPLFVSQFAQQKVSRPLRIIPFLPFVRRRRLTQINASRSPLPLPLSFFAFAGLPPLPTHRSNRDSRSRRDHDRWRIHDRRSSGTGSRWSFERRGRVSFFFFLPLALSSLSLSLARSLFCFWLRVQVWLDEAEPLSRFLLRLDSTQTGSSLLSSIWTISFEGSTIWMLWDITRGTIFSSLG